MYYEAQLRLMRDAFRKCRVQTTIADLNSLPEQPEEQYIPFPDGGNPAAIAHRLLSQPEQATIYRLRDPFHCNYICLLLPELPGDALLVIGPYLSAPPTNQQIMEWAENNGIPPSRQKVLNEYYAGLPILPDASRLFMLLEAFFEQLWGVNSFTVEYLDRDSFVSLPLFESRSAEDEKSDMLWRMKNMEMRYSYENELINAVSKGQLHKADRLLNGVSTFFFEQRASDPLRDAKNYCIIMNTLLRKAAEQGGVHPMFLDSASSAYAVKIEQLVSLEEVLSLMTEMFRSYCRLVQKHATKDYSPPVQQALVFIEANLTGDLNLRTLAEVLNISSSYLSTIFKKETGQTLTDFIASRRIEQAKKLLQTTRLQVQTVAQHCGIMDVHYFSKIFKKVTGMTPKVYRESLKR